MHVPLSLLHLFGGVAQWLGDGLWLADDDDDDDDADLWLTCDHFVGKVSAVGQPTRPTQPSIRPGSVNEYKSV